ncbi:MAG TPA: hypothetical protein VNR11_03990 [Xanthobacteraceae bacterium]|nr:hypothetical protein [Xanthobacteraceae bacterium]
MRTLAATLLLVSAISPAFAQGETQDKAGKAPGDSSHSTGRTEVPASDGKMQPQGPTGPLNTTSGGAPAASPQGQTPPGMQAAPEGSSKTVVDDKDADKK